MGLPVLRKIQTLGLAAERAVQQNTFAHFSRMQKIEICSKKLAFELAIWCVGFLLK
jgi:hypothetical protein